MSYLFTDWDEAQAQQQIAKTSKQKIKLRPYQLTAVDAVYEEWLARMVRSTMVNIPTGGGKSVVFSEVMRRWDVSAMGKILLIAHRKELILQAIGHAMRAGLSSGMEMAGQHATGHEDVIVASVQTLNASRKCGVCFGEGCDECYNGKVKRFTRFNPRDFGLVVVDECVVGSTRIALANGSEATAETLFRNNKSVYVLSMNHDTGLIEPKPITARKVSTTQRIIVIRLKDGSTIECTPNHPVYCKRGYTPAETLTPKDVVLKFQHDNTKAGTVGLRVTSRRCSYENFGSVSLSSLHSSAFRKAIRVGQVQIRGFERSCWDSSKAAIKQSRLGRSSVGIQYAEQPRFFDSFENLLPQWRQDGNGGVAVDYQGTRSCVVVHGRWFKTKSRCQNFNRGIFASRTRVDRGVVRNSLAGQSEDPQFEARHVFFGHAPGCCSPILPIDRAIRATVDAIQTLQTSLQAVSKLRMCFHSQDGSFFFLQESNLPKGAQGDCCQTTVSSRSGNDSSENARSCFRESKRDDLHSVRRHVHDRGFQKATLRELGVQKSSPEVVLCQVLSVTTEERTETVYDFTVDGNHNYFANGVLVHNCHHATSTSYRSVMKWFEQNPLQKTLMVTATPRRADKVGLHNVCQSIAYTMELREAIDEGWLVPIRQKFVTVEGLDISKVEVRAGKLNEGQVEAAFLGTDEDEERMLHSIVKPTIDEAAGRKTLVFAAGKDHAHKLSSCFAAHGVEAGVVVEDTDSAERAELIARYSNGDLQVLVGCLVFSEGFDAPSTEIIANCRPTKSESLYLQILGRSTRPLPGVVDGPETAEERRAAIAASAKPAAIMLDFVGNSGDIKLISVADVLAGDKIDPIDLEEALRVAVKSGETVDIEELAEKAKQSRLEAEQRKEVERRQRLLTNTKADRADYSTVDVDLFGGPEFSSNGDKHVEPITKGQQGFLYHQLGMSSKKTKNMSKKQASAIIARTFKQAGDDWKRLIKEADSPSSLAKVGKAIKDRKSSDYLLKDERVLESLRAAYKAREKEIGG